MIPAVKKNIAIIEDEPALRENYAAALSRNGYQVKTYANRKAAMQAFGVRLPDLAIIDISLEDEAEGGFDLCRDLRNLSAELPIIFLTARDSELDAVSGLRLGADDFLTKDVSLPHLAARVAALFRRIDALRRPGGGAEAVRRGALDDRRREDADDVERRARDLEPHGVLDRSRARRAIPGTSRIGSSSWMPRTWCWTTTPSPRTSSGCAANSSRSMPAFDAIQTVYGMGYRWVE